MSEDYCPHLCLARKWTHPTLGPGFGSQCSNKPKKGSEFCGIHAAQCKKLVRCRDCSKKQQHPVIHRYRWECGGRIDQPMPDYFKCRGCKHRLRNCTCQRQATSNDVSDFPELDSYPEESIVKAITGEGEPDVMEQVSEIIMLGHLEKLENYLATRNVTTDATSRPNELDITPSPNHNALMAILVEGQIRYIDLEHNLFHFQQGDYQFVGKHIYHEP